MRLLRRRLLAMTRQSPCRVIALILLMIFSLSQAHATQIPLAKALVTEMVEKLRGHTNVSVYELTVTRPTWSRTTTLKVWDARGSNHLLLRILDPAKDKGIGFLRRDYNLWMYMPKVEKTIKIPPSMMLQPWMGSDFANDDLVKESSYIDDYTHHIEGEEVLDGQKVWRIELLPKPQAPVVWGKLLLWLRQADRLPVRQQYFSEAGELIRDLRFKEIKVLDGVSIPTVWEMTPVKKPGNATRLVLKEIDFDPFPAIPETVFTEQHLKSIE